MSYYGSTSYGGGDSRYSDHSAHRGGSSYGGGSYGGGSGSGFGGPGGKSGGNLGANLRSINWDFSQLPVFEKNFYFEHPAVSARSEPETEAWRRSNNITVIGTGIPKPCMTFEEASMPGRIGFLCLSD
jgi:ATP-dependent RNA helicase DDX5/DBP2